MMRLLRAMLPELIAALGNSASWRWQCSQASIVRAAVVRLRDEYALIPLTSGRRICYIHTYFSTYVDISIAPGAGHFDVRWSAQSAGATQACPYNAAASFFYITDVRINSFDTYYWLEDRPYDMLTFFVGFFLSISAASRRHRYR